MAKPLTPPAAATVCHENMKITSVVYEQNFKGWQIVDCVVRSKSFFYFILREDYTQSDEWEDGMEPPAEESLEVRVVCFAREKVAPQNWGHNKLNGVKFLLAGVSKIPKEQFVGVDLNGQVYVLGAGESQMENAVPSSWQAPGPRRGVISRSRTIDGYLYICGNRRSVGRRDHANNWKSYTQDIPLKERHEGFEDIDGFSQSDIYCVGGKGDVWHFNGKKWQQIHFPSNLDLYTVCCGGDGYVYISGYGGTTFKGRGDQWKQIYKGEMTISFKDMVWYENKVWCTSDYGLWVIENIQLSRPMLILK